MNLFKLSFFFDCIESRHGDLLAANVKIIFSDLPNLLAPMGEAGLSFGLLNGQIAFLDTVRRKYDTLAIFWPFLNVEENSTF